MKSTMPKILSLLALILAFTCSTVKAQGVLSGTYTIGTAEACVDCDYPSLQSAINDLNTLGISNHVTFKRRI